MCAWRREVRSSLLKIVQCTVLISLIVIHSLFTLSYSLSMIPSYFALLDRIDNLWVLLSQS